MSAHAPYAPSSAHRWLQCAGSLVPPREEKPAGLPAARGTALHEVAELILRGDQMGESLTIDDVQHDLDNDEQSLVNMYIGYIRGLIETEQPEAWAIEQRVGPHSISPKLWGTADFFSWAFAPPKLHIIDFKSGYGPVAAAGNAQMIIYALGVMQREDKIDHAEEVVLTIVQPRLTQMISSYVCDADEMRYWESRLRSTIELHEKFPYVRSPGNWCKWCNHEQSCPTKQSYDMAQTRGVLPSAHNTDADVSEDEALAINSKAIIGRVQEALRNVYRTGSEVITVREKTFRGWTAEGLAQLREEHGAKKVHGRFSMKAARALGLTSTQINELTETTRRSYELK